MLQGIRPAFKFNVVIVSIYLKKRGENMFKKIIASVLATLMLLIVLPTKVNASTQPISTYSSGNVIQMSDYLTKDDLEFMTKLQSIYPYFAIDNNGKLYLTLEINELKNKFQLDEQFIQKLNDILQYSISNNNLQSYSIGSNLGLRRVFAKDWKIYFSYEEVESLFVAAANAGPAAMTAAFAAIGIMYPVFGPIVGTLIGIVGGGTICYHVLQSAALRQGLYIGVDWNGPFPIPAIGNW